jgi:YhcH/YjgK/YiaL family protein
MALFGSIETLRQQAPPLHGFAVAWTYITEVLQRDSSASRRLLGLAVGESFRHELGSGVFAIEQVYRTRARSEGFFESHRKYIDIQVVVAGEEIMEVLDVTAAVVREPYQEGRDLIVYHDNPAGSHLRIGAGQAAIFFPTDVHMPTLQCAEPVVLRKSVLKVPVS